MPLHSQVHVDRPLTNFAVEYKNEKLIARDVVPFVPVQNKSDSYMSYTQADRFTLPQSIRGPKAEANEVDWSATTASYACIDHALREFLPDALVGNADPGVDPRRRTAEFVTDLILLIYERIIATMVFTAGNYDSGKKVTLTGADQWSSFATSDPIGNVETARAATFVEPNIGIMGKTVWAKLKQHPQVLSRITGGSTKGDPAMVSTRLVAELFELDELYIGKSKYNTANKGGTASFSDVWGDFFALIYQDKSAGLEGVSAFKTFRWNQLSTAMGYQVRTYRDEAKGGGGEWIEVETSFDEVMVCSDVGYLISDLIA